MYVFCLGFGIVTIYTHTYSRLELEWLTATFTTEDELSNEFSMGSVLQVAYDGSDFLGWQSQGNAGGIPFLVWHIVIFCRDEITFR